MIKINKRTLIPSSENIWKTSAPAVVIDLQHYFSDSSIDKLMMSQASIRSIFDWVKNSPNEEQGERFNIPEKGGLLMGAYQQNEDHLSCFIHSFAPITEVNLQTNVLWKVDKGIAPALLQATDSHPDLLVMGWLHTHPGHGPYLSMTDLVQTQIFFPHNYQIAIVIDPTTESFDTGLFSRQSNGKMNNASDQRQIAHWKEWLNA